MTFEVGSPDPAANGPVIEHVEQVYGIGVASYERRTEQRDRLTRAVVAALETSTDVD